MEDLMVARRGATAWLWITLLWLSVGLLLGGSPATVSAQAGPYRLDTGRELALLGAGAAAFGIGQVASARMDVLSAEEISALDRARIAPRFDVYPTRQSGALALRISDFTGYGSVVLPALLVFGESPRGSLGEVAVIFAEVLAINNGLTNLIKNTVRRPRPYVYNEQIPLSRKRIKDARRSFFSGHTSNTAANSFFAARAYADFYPDAGAKPYVWAGAIALPAVTGLTRVLAGRHYWTDVAVGYAVGAAVGLIIPALH